MSHQDRALPIVVNHQTLLQVVNWLLPRTLFCGMKTRRGATWKPRMLAVAALLWSVGSQINLGERFETARKIVKKVFRWQPDPGATWQGFMKQLAQWHAELMLAVASHLQTQMKKVLPGQWEIAGYVIFAGDGSRIELPRTKALEKEYSPRRLRHKGKPAKQKKKRNGKKASRRAAPNRSRKRRYTKKQTAAAIAKKANSAQMWLTLLWHVGSGLPWDWRTGPSDSSERAHLLESNSSFARSSRRSGGASFAVVRRATPASNSTGRWSPCGASVCWASVNWSKTDWTPRDSARSRRSPRSKTPFASTGCGRKLSTTISGRSFDSPCSTTTTAVPSKPAATILERSTANAPARPLSTMQANSKSSSPHNLRSNTTKFS